MRGASCAAIDAAEASSFIESSTAGENMPLLFRDNWEDTNTTTPKMDEGKIKSKIHAALTPYAGTDSEVKILQRCTLSDDARLKVFVTKGLHQEEGNSILPRHHVTIEDNGFPAKRFHVYFIYVTMGKNKDWYTESVTYKDSAGQTKEIELARV